MFLLLLAAMAFRPAGDPTTLHGNVVVKSMSEHEIVTFVDEDGDRVVDDTFAFWSESPLPPLDYQTSDATIDYRGDALTVTSADGISIAFAINGEASATRMVGYGLNHHTGRFANQFRIDALDGREVGEVFRCYGQR